MGIVSIRTSVWKRVGEKWELVETSKGLSPTKTFLGGFSFRKARNSFTCCLCRCEKPKNTRYLGGQYSKICSDCAVEWIENSLKSLENMKNLLKESKKNFELNKDKWKREMILGGLNETN